MKLSVLGSCSGTEPFENRHHTAFALTLGERIYWFDAGETCSYTAHLMGLDLLSVSDIFISHPHMDHVGGLPNLLWTIRKLCRAYKRPLLTDGVDVYLSARETWDGVMQILRNTEGSFELPFALEWHSMVAGLLFDDGDVRVTAYPNTHVKPADGVVRSYSFLIECEGRRIVYSGDVKGYSELDEAIGAGCDLLIGETAHHVLEEVFDYVARHPIGRVVFTHHKREIMENTEATSARVKELLGNKAVIAYDGMEVVL